MSSADEKDHHHKRWVRQLLERAYHLGVYLSWVPAILCPPCSMLENVAAFVGRLGSEDGPDTVWFLLIIITPGNEWLVFHALLSKLDTGVKAVVCKRKVC